MVVVITAPDDEKHRVAIRPVHEMVTDLYAGLEARRVSLAQHDRSVIVDERHLAVDHVDELVLFRVPMALTRPDAGR